MNCTCYMRIYRLLFSLTLRIFRYQGITIHSKQAVENAKKTSWPSQTDDKTTIVEAPGGYKFHLVAEDVANGTNSVHEQLLSGIINPF